MKSIFGLRAMLYAIAITSVLSSCDKTEMNDTPPAGESNPDIIFYALDAGARLYKYNAKDPQNPISSVGISGTLSAEIIQAIDFRPATGQLYGLGSSSRLYVIDPNTGVSRPLGTTTFTPAIDGNIVAFDFNPTVDRIRVVTNNGQNLRLHPETGAVVATDGTINGPANAAIGAVAYTNNMSGATSTILYDIDINNKKLYKQDPPNNGTLVEVGPLNLDISAEAGFDISPDNSVALAVFFVGGKSTLAKIDLNTGNATSLGALGNAANYLSIAIPTAPVAYAVDEINNLHIFNPENPVIVTKAIGGLQAGEMIVGIDFRPANGQLYALGSSSRLYTINLGNGAATVVGGVLTTALNGTDFGFDFNPTVDRIRVVSNMGQNLRLNPNDGAVAAVDAALNPGTPAVTAAAYTNNFAGATTTTLFDIDTNTDKLYRQDPPNNGTLVEIGSLGIDADAANGFDIGGTSGKAWAILKTASGNKIYSINLTTGAATPAVDFPKTVKGFAVGLGF